MNFSVTFRKLQCLIVTSASTGKKFYPNGESIQTMWWTGMHGKLAHLDVTSFPETITITDTDRNNEVLNYKVANRTESMVTYESVEMPSLPIYLKAA